jgi:hypothetical protein
MERASALSRYDVLYKRRVTPQCTPLHCCMHITPGVVHQTATTEAEVLSTCAGHNVEFTKLKLTNEKKRATHRTNLQLQVHTPLSCQSGILSSGQLQPHIQVVPYLPPEFIPRVRPRSHALLAEPLLPPRDLHQVLQTH